MSRSVHTKVTVHLLAPFPSAMWLQGKQLFVLGKRVVDSAQGSGNAS